jgi:hypothetical protein
MTRRTNRWAPVAVATGVLAATLCSTFLPATAADETADGVADWTVMVYAVGDTDNVAEVMVQNLGQLAALPDDADVNVVVLLDLPDRDTGQAPTSTLPGIGEFSTAKLMVVSGNRFNEIRDLGEIAMGRPDVLAGFIEEAAGRFPAEHYALSLYDHGGGNTGGYVDIGPPGTSDLIVPEIRDGMAAGMARAGIDRFDLLFHAACLMSNYETVSALAPLAATMTASEELMYKWPFSPQGVVAAQAGGGADEIGAAFIDGYKQMLADDAAVDGDHSVLDLLAMANVDGDAVARLDAALASFSQVAVANMEQIAPEVARARAAALEFVVGFQLGIGSFELVDLGDFLRHLENVPEEVQVARDAAFAALDEVVTYQQKGTAAEQATGLNVFLPSTPDRLGSYLDDGTAPAGWGSFVRAFLESGAATGVGTEAVSFVNDDATVVEEGPAGIKIQSQLTNSENVAYVDTMVYTRIGEVDQAVTLVLPAYLHAGGEGMVQGVWDYARTTVSDGESTAPVTTVYQAQSGGFVGEFEAQYTPPEGTPSDVLFRVLLSSEGEVQSWSVAAMEGEAAAGLELQPGGVLSPYLYVPSSGSFSRELSSQSVRTGEQFTVGSTRMPAGARFDMVLTAYDAAWNFDSSHVSGQVR